MNDEDGGSPRPADRDGGQGGNDWPRPPREPMLNLPRLVTVFAGLLVAIHGLRAFFPGQEAEFRTMILFAFIPARYGELAASLPDPAAAVWSPITYSLLHGSWTHLLVNLFWLVAFASPVANRLGTGRALAIAAIASLGGAAAHYLAYPGELVPMVGASAVVSGFMGAAARFALSGSEGARLNVHGRARSLVESFANPRFLAFLLVWLVLNYLSGAGAVPIAGDDVAIAWQAHLGGFLAGLLGFSLFDRS